MFINFIQPFISSETASIYNIYYMHIRFLIITAKWFLTARQLIHTTQSSHIAYLHITHMIYVYILLNKMAVLWKNRISRKSQILVEQKGKKECLDKYIFSYSIYLIFSKIPWDKFYYSYFPDEEIEALWKASYLVRSWGSYI